VTPPPPPPTPTSPQGRTQPHKEEIPAFFGGVFSRVFSSSPAPPRPVRANITFFLFGPPPSMGQCWSRNPPVPTRLFSPPSTAADGVHSYPHRHLHLSPLWQNFTRQTPLFFSVKWTHDFPPTLPTQGQRFSVFFCRPFVAPPLFPNRVLCLKMCFSPPPVQCSP